MQSILAVDCGTLYTRATLIDVVGDEYRFVGSAASPTTTEKPFGDITIGVNGAIAELEHATGRQFVIDGRIITPQRSDGHGIDVLVASCSAAPALRLVVSGLTREFSTTAASEAAASTYTDVLDTISLDDQPRGMVDSLGGMVVPEGWWVETQAQKLLALQPDAVLVAGGVEGGTIGPLMRLGRLLLRAYAEQRQRAKAKPGAADGPAPQQPLVFFAGNSAALDALHQVLGDTAEIVALPNVQPDLGQLDVDPLQAALRRQYQRRQLPLLPGYDALSTWSRTALQPSLHAVELMTRYVSAEYRREVLVADVGASNVGLIFAASRDGGQHAAAIRGNFGLAQGLANLLAEVGADNVLRWLPFPLSATELANWALNKLIRPLLLPESARDLAIEQAFAREALRVVTADLRRRSEISSLSFDLLVGTGGLLASAPRSGQSALVLLDGIQPTGEGVGSFELALDSTLLLPALGTLAQVQPAAAAYVFDRDCLFMLGPCIVPLGTPLSLATARDARKAARSAAESATPTGVAIAVEVTVEIIGGESHKYDVPYGTIQVIPLRPEQRAGLIVKPGPGFHIGHDEPGKVVQTQPGEEIKGGLIGLIIDARGRPLALPDDDAARIAKLLEWGRAMRAYSPRENFGYAPVAAPPVAAPAPTPATVTPAATAQTVAAGIGRPFGQRSAPAASAPTVNRTVPEQPTQTAPRPGTGPLRAPGAIPGANRPPTGPLRMPEPPAPPEAPRRRPTAPLIWPTGEPPQAPAPQASAEPEINPPHLSSGRRPTGPLVLPGEEKRQPR